MSQNQKNIRPITDISSNEFKKVIKLSDKNTKTLGFLPYSAFEKYALQKQLIGAFEKNSNELLGYLLYRISHNRITIIHLCIDETKRKNKIAKKLVDYLKKKTKKYQGIRLSCRNDYDIDNLWKSFNFIPITEKTGRSKKKSLLTVWWFSHNHNDLFTLESERERQNKIIAVIDTNIFIDIINTREPESLALNGDWVMSEVTIHYTKEIYIEISQANDLGIREATRNQLSHFELLPSEDEEEFEKILSELEQEIPVKNENDKSDLRHIAYSISGDAQFFITRDSDVLNKKSIFKKHGLTVCRPSEFITQLDENIQVSKYKPQSLIGTNINSTRLTATNIDDYTTLFLKPFEKKNSFQQIIRKALSDPNKFELTTVSKNQTLLAFVIFDRTVENKLKIPIFRFLKSDLKTTLIKHLLFKLVLTATNEERTFIEITEQYLDDDLKNAIQEARFVEIDNAWHKMNIKGILETGNLNSRFNQEPNAEKILSKINDRLLNNSSVDSDFIKKYSYERYFSPLKIKDLEIPTYIVPIKPHWAEQLFNDKSKETLAFYEPEYELLLNRENVYYRSAKPKIITAPARILWYSSENPTTRAKGSVIATSYVDEVFIDTPKKLFKQFEKLGIYKWDEVSETAGKKNELMAFIFSDTELFKNPISLKDIIKIFKDLENKKFMIITPIKIKTATYLSFYKQGINS